MIGTNIVFTRERNGYDRGQVDSYIKKVSETYQTTYSEYLDINSKYEKLLEEHENLESREMPGMNSEIAAKTLISTELLANKIITEAQAEAAAIIEEAQKSGDAARAEAESLSEEAQRRAAQARSEADSAREEAQRSVAEARMEAQKSVADAQAEADAIIAEARRIRDDAITEAAGINKAANKILEEARSEAATTAGHIRTDIEQAHRILQRALGEVEELLTYDEREEESGYEAA